MSVVHKKSFVSEHVLRFPATSSAVGPYRVVLQDGLVIQWVGWTGGNSGTRAIYYAWCNGV